MSELVYLKALYHVLCSRCRLDERGEVTEKVLVTAIFAALALAAGAVITVKVMSKANEIPTK